jgi:hypothetical protein
LRAAKVEPLKAAGPRDSYGNHPSAELEGTAEILKRFPFFSSEAILIVISYR